MNRITKQYPTWAYALGDVAAFGCLMLAIGFLSLLAYGLGAN